MGINPSDLNLKNPVVKYLASAIKNGSTISKKGDVRFSPIMSRRFAVGIDNNRKIYVAMLSEEAFIFQEFTISEITFVRKVNDQDWLVISSPDISNGRGKDKKGHMSKQVPIRFWYPANSGIFDGFYGISDDKTIHLTEMNFVNNHPEASGESFVEVPLKLKGNWDDVEYIEEEEEQEIIIERTQPTGVDDILAGEDELDLALSQGDFSENFDDYISDVIPDDLKL